MDLSKSDLQELRRQNKTAESKYYHDELKCEISLPFKVCQKSYGKVVCVSKVHCYTHNIDICHCKWEIYYHGGIYNRLLNPKSNGKRISDVPTIH